ncbi:MAG TPA: glycosyltransferase family 39 protein [Candidatus Omnitrophota bacterium]|nr:glycosyltransferase family 39 protein [Candidatus Omnitrophota bacterium]
MNFFASKKTGRGWLIFFTALVCRLLHLVAVKDFIPFKNLLGDVYFFDQFAWKIATGAAHSETLTATLTPVYLAFLGACYKLFGHQLLVPRLIQIVLGSLSCVLIYKTGKILWNRAAGTLAGFIAAFYGIFIFYDAELRKPCLVNFLLISTLYLLSKVSAKQGITRWILAAIAFSTAASLRMNLAIGLLAILLWSVICLRRTYKRTDLLFYLSIFMLTFFVVLTAWRVWFNHVLPRQEASFEESGLHFYIGNHPDATGTYGRVKGIRAGALGHTQDSRKIVETEFRRPVTNEEINRYWWNKGVRFILENPSRWIALEAKKLFLILNAYEIPNDENFDFTRRNSWFLSFPLLSFGWVAPFGFLGIFCLRKEKNPAAYLLPLILGFYIFSLLLIFVTSAYRLPMQIPLILLAARGILCLRETWVSKKAGLFGFYCGVLFFFFVTVNRVTFLPKYRYDNFMTVRIERTQKQLTQQQARKLSSQKPRGAILTSSSPASSSPRSSQVS